MHWQLLTVALVVAAPVPAEKEKKDEEKIQGTWTVVSLESGGKKAPDDDVKNVKFVFKDDTVTINDPKREEKAKIKLDASKKPKAIDIQPEDKGGDKKPVLGIYELKDDELKICFAKGGGERPTELVSKAGTEQSLVVLKREKKEK
jgi:uncharacterized protein (TIGR03067 family)